MRIYFDNQASSISPRKVRQVSPPIGYLLPSTLGSKACSFGIGDRFKNRNGSPVANTDVIYDLPTVFKPDNTTSTFSNHMVGSKTFSFGTGRSDIKSRVLNVENLQPDK